MVVWLALLVGRVKLIRPRFTTVGENRCRSSMVENWDLPASDSFHNGIGPPPVMAAPPNGSKKVLWSM
jgi:hypothetical protein